LGTNSDQVDGVANNDGIMMIASTNYLDRLDPGLTKRPSRFDRKYLFPLPSRVSSNPGNDVSNMLISAQDERILYAQFWQQKLKEKPIDFPDVLCPAVADITEDFSFAYMQELFIASLLQIARGDGSEAPDSVELGGGDLDQYQLWRVLKRQAEILREDMGKEDPTPSAEHAVSAIEPHQSGAEASMTFPVSSRGLVSGNITHAVREEPRNILPVLGSRRLTPQQAALSLSKASRIGDRAFTWGPSPYNY
jgi:hypothetical protein